MSGLQDFLSHLIFAHRDSVIVLLGGLLGWLVILLLIARWRNERLHRDLASAKSGGASGGARRYVTNAPSEEAQVESGALPPVKGGRTYARNLGTALQKAGIAQQIYSPPSPAGWAPNTNQTQPAMAQPGPAYAPQNAPWAAPAAPQGSPWGGYPAGGGRGMPNPSPSGVPFYQPAQAPQQPQPLSQPIAPPAGVPGPYGPPAGSPFAAPAFSPVASGPPAQAPSWAPAGPPGPPPIAPPVEPAAADPSAGDGGRRGKPKRRRFNFNVLENLEKMVQQRTAEPAPPTGWTPPAAPATPAPMWTPPVPPAPVTGWTPPASPPAAIPAPSVAPARAFPPTPQSTIGARPLAAEADAAVEETPADEAIETSLPLRFGPEVEAEAEETATVETEPEPDAEPIAAEAPEAELEPEPHPEAEPEPVREARGSMRSMLFGEESVSTHKPEPAREPAAIEPEPEPEPVRAAYQWRETAPVQEPITEDPESEEVRPWSTTPIWEPEPEPEPVTTVEPAATSDIPETPTAGRGDEPSAGIVVIIEDDPTAATYYATLFRGNGYRVEVANDGVSGVDLCTRLQPQLIMLDVMMPRQNGILVLQTLRASDETKNTPVVVMSNFSEPTLIKRAVQLGALEYVIKTQVEGPALLKALPRWMNHEKAFAAA